MDPHAAWGEVSHERCVKHHCTSARTGGRGAYVCGREEGGAAGRGAAAARWRGALEPTTLNRAPAQGPRSVSSAWRSWHIFSTSRVRIGDAVHTASMYLREFHRLSVCRLQLRCACRHVTCTCRRTRRRDWLCGRVQSHAYTWRKRSVATVI
eukprot:3097129-Prymnesium_polylepis.2